MGIEADLIEGGQNWIEKLGAQVNKSICSNKARRDGRLAVEAAILAQRLQQKQPYHSSASSSSQHRTLMNWDFFSLSLPITVEYESMEFVSNCASLIVESHFSAGFTVGKLLSYNAQKLPDISMLSRGLIS